MRDGRVPFVDAVCVVLVFAFKKKIFRPETVSYPVPCTFYSEFIINCSLLFQSHL